MDVKTWKGSPSARRRASNRARARHASHSAAEGSYDGAMCDNDRRSTINFNTEDGMWATYATVTASGDGLFYKA